MLFETDRLRLRPLFPADRPRIAALQRDLEVMAAIMDGREESDAEIDARFRSYIEDWQSEGIGFWLMFEKAAGEGDGFVGRCGFRRFEPRRPQLGYCLFGHASGRGLASEASRIVIAAAFARHDIDTVVSLVRPANHRSLRLMEKLGFARSTQIIRHGVSYEQFVLERANWSGPGMPEKGERPGAGEVP